MKNEVLTLELNINYICKDTIKKRKAIYGNNFPQIAKMQNEYNKNLFNEDVKNKNFIMKFILNLFNKLFGKKITPKDVAMNLAILKQVRIDFIRAKLQELKNDVNFDTYIIQTQIKDLKTGLEDSLKDYSNYLWISQNYSEYESL